MPIIGLGTWESKDGDEAYNAVKWALEIGYRHIDTAAIYGNEESVGRAIKDSKIPREEIFLTTKLWNEDHERVEEAFNESLKKLQVDYVDLYLIHWPVPERKETWKLFEKLNKEGKAKSIGVSNFTIRHLEGFLPECKIKPAVNQVEFSPFLYQKDLWEFCKKHDIVLEAYSPLSRGKKLDNETVGEIAKKYGKTPAQIIIRWHIDKNIVVIPKSVTKERIESNSQLDFALDPEDVEKLDNLNENFRCVMDPSGMP